MVAEISIKPMLIIQKSVNYLNDSGGYVALITGASLMHFNKVFSSLSWIFSYAKDKITFKPKNKIIEIQENK